MNRTQIAIFKRDDESCEWKFEGFTEHAEIASEAEEANYEGNGVVVQTFQLED